MLKYKASGQEVKVGDKVPGKRLGKYYAHVIAIHPNSVELLYNGDVKNTRVSFNAIDAIMVDNKAERIYIENEYNKAYNRWVFCPPSEKAEAKKMLDIWRHKFFNC